MGVFTTDGTENRMRWNRRTPGFMEVWYATANHRPTGTGLWVRYTLTAPKAGHGSPYCELWGFLFDPDGKKSFGAKNRFPIDRLGGSNGRDDGALVRIGDAWMSENHLEGSVVHGDRHLRWSLDFDPADRCFHLVPSQLRARVEKRLSVVCSPNLAVPLRGVVTLDGEEFVFAGERGTQSHRWGRRNPVSWTWAHCSSFDEGGDAVFEGVAARPTLGRFPLPTTTLLYLSYEGEDIVFNDFKWALRAKGRYEMPTWAFTARTDTWKIAGAARVVPDRLMQVTYVDPDGSERFCANSELADLGIELYARAGTTWRHHASLTAIRSAHIEFGRRERFLEVPVVV
jgi:hypothetical protein